MANIKITDLNAYSDPASTDVLPIVDVGADETKKVSIADLMENAGAGTEALPGIAFNGDPNTGIYSPGADTVGVSTAGTERMRIDSAGNVGIGTSSPGELLEVKTGLDRALLVRGNRTSLPVDLFACNPASSYSLRDLSITGNTIQFNIGGNTGTSNTERLRIDSAGNVGIGTSSPSELLHLSGSGTQRIRITETGSTLYTQVVQTSTNTGIVAAAPLGLSNELSLSTTSNGSSFERLRIDSAGNVGIGTSSPQQLLHLYGTNNLYMRLDATGGNVNNEILGGLEQYNRDNSGAGPTVVARVQFLSSSIHSGGGGQIALQTHDTTGGEASEPTTRLLIDQSGNVGIGTTSPDYRLEVAESGGPQLNLRNSDASSGGVATNTTLGIVGFAGTDSITWGSAEERVAASIRGVAEASWTATTSTHKAGISFLTQADSSVGKIERLRIDSAGNVGIGTTNPKSLLHISEGNTGSARFIVGGLSGTDARSASIIKDADTPYQLTIRASDNASVSAGDIVFDDALAERMRITSAGRVGIGTSSPAYQLTVEGSNPYLHLKNTGTDTGSSRVLFGDANSGTPGQIIYDHTDNSLRTNVNNVERMRIDSAGRLLVGTTSSFSGGLLQVRTNTAGSERFISFRSDWNALGFPSVLSFERSLGNGVVSNNAYLGSVAWKGYDGASMVTAGTIQCLTDGTPGSNDMPGRLVFSTTADGASSPTERMRITSGGDVIFKAGVAVSTLTNNETAFINDSGFGQRLRFGNTYGAGKSYCVFTTNGTNVGSIAASGTTGTAYNTTSDYRLKENIVAVTDGITRLQQLKPSRFNFIADPDKTVDGFIAHEVQAVVPEAITGEKDAVDENGDPVYQGIDQSKLVPLLTAALQEAVAEINALKDRLTAAGL